MAKVTGPLYSMTASGKIADAMVFFTWKGRAVVRQWLIPKNAESPDQGDQRLILGGTGRAAGAVKPTSAYAGQLGTLGVIPTDQTRQSYLVKRIIEAYFSTPTLYEAQYTAYAAHLAVDSFQAEAIGIGLIEMNVTYKGTAHAMPAGMQLYILAKTAIDLNFVGSPYTIALASWVLVNIQAMVADLAAV